MELKKVKPTTEVKLLKSFRPHFKTVLFCLNSLKLQVFIRYIRPHVSEFVK